MALVLANRVRETSTTTGTGTLTLAGAVVGYQTFSAGIGASNTCYYAISNPGVAEWEVGVGTVGSPATTLARTTILASSNAGSAVNFSAGTKDVFVTYPSSKSVYLDASGNAGFPAGTVSAPSIYLSTDTGTGFYRIGANNDGFAVSGAKVLDIASTGLSITGALSSTGALTVTDATQSTSTSTGSIITSGGVGIAKALQVGGTLTYGGVTLSNSVTGTGSMVLSASPTLTGTLTAAIANFSGAVATGALSVTGTGSFTDTITSTKNGAGFTQSVSSGQNALVQLTDGTKVFRMWHTTTDALQFGTTSAHSWDLTYNGNTIGTVNSGGFAVTGTGSTTGNMGVGALRSSVTGFTKVLNVESTDAAIQLYQTTTGTSWEIGNDNTGQFRILNGGANKLTIAAAGSVTVTGTLTVSSTITTLGGATFHTTSSALTNGAGAGSGTLLNAPAAGNPTKWIGINDNGTTRYIPAW